MKNSELANEWLQSAISDLELASKGKVSERIRYETLCFHAQQATEKSLKAILVSFNKPFPKTHNIEHLFQLIKGEKIIIPKGMDKAKILTDYAVDTRYPDDFTVGDKIDKKEYKQAVALADKILQWAKLMTEKHPDELF